MKRSALTVSIVVSALALFSAACAQSASPSSDVAKLQQQVTQAQSQITAAQQQITQLQTQMSNVALNAVSGGGINLKMMPDPATGQPTVPMEEVFSFNRAHAMCLVADNPKAFSMPTYSMGTVTIKPHTFYMSMVTTSINETTIKTLENGHTQVTMVGGLDCATEVAGETAATTLGSRTVPEHADYTVVAEDVGIGGGKAGDTFKFTVRFDKEKAPINYAIFGPEFTFTGNMTVGEIIIVDPARLTAGVPAGATATR